MIWKNDVLIIDPNNDVWLSKETVRELLAFFEDSDRRNLIGLTTPELDGESYAKLFRLTADIPQHSDVSKLLMAWVGEDSGRLSALITYVFQRGWQFGNKELLTSIHKMDWIALIEDLTANDVMLQKYESLFAALFVK